MTEQAPILAHDLRSISTTGQTAMKLCNALFGLCPNPPVNPLTITFPKPKPSHPKNFGKAGTKPPFQVAHISDVHIDRNYTAGAEADCTKPICCRADSSNTTVHTEPAGPFGNPKCDSPVPLAESMITQISRNNKFSIFTGDVVEGSVP